MRQFSFLLPSAVGRIQPVVYKMLMKISPSLGSFVYCCACERAHSITAPLGDVQQINKDLFDQPSTNSADKFCSMFRDRRGSF